MKKIEELDVRNSLNLVDELSPLGHPVVLRNLVRDWPAVAAAKQSDQAIKDYVLSFDQGRAITVYKAPHEANGRIFYNDEFSGFNFTRERQPLTSVLRDGTAIAETAMYYVGSTMIKHWLTGFESENTIDLGDSEHINSIWLGNQSLVAPHFDFPSNIACVVAGKRKITLFAPDQFENLYVGPFDLTPSGQPISLVDVRNPDYQAFPKYRDAQASSFEAVLEPGDAVYIPSMWWHAVEALSDFNVLVNYWWRSTPSFLGSPMAALQHAMLSFKDLPSRERKAWANLFGQLVFNESPDCFEHIPESIKGMLGAVDEATAIKIRRAIAEAVKV